MMNNWYNIIIGTWENGSGEVQEIKMIQSVFYNIL